MVDKIKKLKNNVFIKNVIILVTGTAAAQLVAMLLSPIITRQYGPSAFGIMGTFTAMISIIAPIAALTYPIAIVLPEKDQDAKGLMKLSMLISVLISLTITVFIFLFGKEILIVFNIEEISYLIYLIPIVVILSALMQVFEQWLIRTQQFSINAKVTFYQSLIINSGKVGVGLFYPVATVLVLFTALANGLKAFMLILFSKKPIENKENWKEVNFTELKELARKYYDFPLYRAPEVFLNSVSTGLPIILLTAFFSPAVAGFYTIVRTVLSLPTQLLGKAVGDVFYPRITEGYNNKEDITSLIKKSTIYLGLIGLVPFGLIVFLGPYLFSLVFGEAWVTSGKYATWIALWSYFAFINRPSVISLPVLKAQRFQLIYTIFMLITRLSVLTLGFLIYKSDIIAIAFYGISGALLNLGLIIITIRISSKKFDEIKTARKIR